MKTFKRIIALFLCLTMVLGLGVIASADEEQEDPDGVGACLMQVYKDWTLDYSQSGVGYWKLDAYYVANPTECSTDVYEDGYVQHIAIWAPAAYMQEEDGVVSINEDGQVISDGGLVFTAENAPIVFWNHSGGYTSSTIQGVNLEMIERGYVYVEMQSRGKEVTDSDGKFIGQFPYLIVDLKAGIRFLREFDAILPGDSESIVVTGHSSGGAVAAMLGASGDAAVFEEYFDEIGAYYQSDAVYIAHASAPITNLNTADASYEWYQKENPEYFLFNAMAYDRLGNPIENFPVGPKNMYPLGSNVLGGAHEDELSEYLYNWYVEYVQDLGLDLGDDGRSGEFYDGFVEVYEASLEEYIERYDEVGDTAKYPTVQEYLDSINKGTDWFTYDAETGKVTIKDLDTLVQNYIQRKKMCPSLDSYNYKSNENNAFKDEDGNVTHFSGTVYEGLSYLYEGYLDGSVEISGKTDPKTKEASEFTEDDLQYLADLVGDYENAGSEEQEYMLDIMSPTSYIIAEEGSEFEATLAEHWRLRVGSADGDHGAPAAWLIYQLLEQEAPEVDAEIGFAWGFGHVWSELKTTDFCEYVEACLVEDGKAQYIDFPVYMTVAADNSGRMPTGLALTDSSYDKYFGGYASEVVPALVSLGGISVNGTTFPATLAEYQETGFSVNGAAVTVNAEDEESYPAAAIAAITKAIPIGNTITLYDEDEDGVCEKIEYNCYAAFIVNKITVLEDGNYNLQRADIDGVKPYDGDLFAAGNTTVIQKENLIYEEDDPLECGDMALAFVVGDEWYVAKAQEVNGILVDGQDHGSYVMDDTEYPDAMKFSRDNIVISNRCGEFTNAMKYFYLNDNEEYPVSLWLVPTDESCESYGAPAGFTSGDSGKKMLEQAIWISTAKLAAYPVGEENAQTGQMYVTQEGFDELYDAVQAAAAVYDDETITTSEAYDYQLYLLYLANHGSGDDIGAKFAGYDYVGYDNQLKNKQFTDVTDESKYYYNAVYTASEAGITKGYPDGTFGVGLDCTRRELMIFLWRAAGEPIVNFDGVYETFSDVSGWGKDTDTYKALAWAISAGITKGYSDGTFRPDDSITRKDTMIMLYRVAGKKEVDGLMTFTDCDKYAESPDTWNSILWADVTGISHGYEDDTFRPDDNCLREQIVTFIYRYLESLTK